MEEPKGMEEPMTMTSICSTCLSQDRHMKPLQSIPLFKTLHWLKLDLVVSAPMVCWECEAALTRAERFRRRAARAQGALRALELSNHQCHQQLTCLTTLSVVGPHTYTHTNYDNVIKLDQLVKNETDGFEDPVQKEGSTTIIESIKTEDENDIKHTDALMDVSSEVNIDSDTYNEKPQQPTSFSLSENGKKEREDDIEPHEQFIVDKTPAPHSIHIAESNNTTDDFVNVFFKSPPVRSYTRINRKRNGVRTLVIFKKVHNAVPTENKRIELTMPKGRSTSIDERHNAVPPKNKTAKLTIPNSRKYVKKDPYDFYKRLRENTDYITVIISEQEMIANIERARSNAMGSDTEKGTSEDTSQADPFQLFLSETQPPPSDPECPLCSKYFDNEEKFMEHCVDFHRTLYQCLKCSYRNFFKDNIFDHIQETHNVFLCQYCFIQLDSEIHLRNHMVENHNALIREKGPVECEQCGKIFRHPCHLREHVQIHLDKEKRRQQCPHCDKKVVLLRHHLRLFHRNNKRIETEQQCPHCDTVVMGDVKLKHHILTVHTRDPKCYCENCDKQFVNVGQYKSHLKRSRVHNPNPPKFQCQHCIKQFTSKITLHSHVEVVHELKKPFVCETCGTACGSRKHLNKHIREKHDTDKAKKPEKKKQICQYCGIECKNSTTLANHLRTHTGEKPYHCAHCDWQFRQRGPLVTHLRGMHPGRVPPRRKR